MVDFGSAAKDRWVCPNDRQLALRAKLKTGWSVKTQSLQQYGRQDSGLNETEQEMILQVIRRAEMLEVTEQERVGRLVERLENMKRNALGNGTNQCVLCGDHFGMLGSPSLLCRDCKKAVCHKCGIETLSSQKEPISLCKICSETREMWKKSGAWFFKGLPKYVLPEKKPPEPGRYGPRRMQRAGVDKMTWSRGSSLSVPKAEEEESSSEDEVTRRSRQQAAANGRLPTQRQPSVTFDLGSSSSAGGGGGGRLSPAPGSLRSDSMRSMSLPSDADCTDTAAAGAVGAVGPAAVTLDHHLHLQQQHHHQQQQQQHYQQQQQQQHYFHPLRSAHGSTGAGPGGGYFRESLDSESSGAASAGSGRTPSLSMHEPSWDGEVDAATHAVYQASIHGHLRRDSQGSRESRDWGWSDDRMSYMSSSSGHRTIGSAGDLMEDAVDNSIIEHSQLGTIELSLVYDNIASALHCSLHRAKGLKPMDINGLSDPFCRLNLLPTGGKSNRLRTKTVHKTRNPEFNETLTFYGVTESDLAKKILHILVLDDDKYGHDFIGEARIVLSGLRPQLVRHTIVPLEKHFLVEQEDEVWGNDAWTRGQILVTLCYSTRRRALVVGIVRCANLTPMDNNGFSDPFVKLRLKPDPYHRKYKTSIKWKNLNPVFNEEFVFDTKMTELPKQALEITVWDKDYGKSNDYLGGLELGWHSKGERLKHWVDMIKFPDHKHEGWHNLGEELLGD